MSKIAFATAIAALTAAVPLTLGRAEAQPLAPYMPNGAAPPWGATTTTTTTKTETQPASTPAATPATPPAPASVEADTSPPTQGATTPIQGAMTPVQVPSMPMQGNTTPIHAVSLRAGPVPGAPIIGTLEPGMPLHVLATANYGWMQVDSPIGSGWAYGSYLAPAGGTVVIQHPAPPQEEIIER